MEQAQRAIPVPRRNLLRGLGALSAGALVAGHPNSAEARQGAADKNHALFIYSLAADNLPLYVAAERGFFSERGLIVEMKANSSAGNVPAALISDSSDIAQSTATVLLQAADAGLDLVAIMGLTRQTPDDRIAALLVKPSVSVKKPADLVGKTVGVSGLNGILSILLQRWLLDNGLSPRQVRLVESSPIQMPDLLRSGQLDAAVVVEPFTSRIVQQGLAEPMPGFLADKANLVFALVVSTRGWAEANRSAIERIKASAAEGLDFIMKNPDEANDIEKKWLNFVSSDFTDFDLSIRSSDLEPYVSILKRLGSWNDNADVSRLVFS